MQSKIQKEFEVILSDTSCLVLLSKIDCLFLLEQLAKSIYITETVFNEFGNSIPDWIKIVNPKNHQLSNVLSYSLDAGEASLIALAMEKKNSVLILDDLSARKMAAKFNLKYTGTIGLLIKAKKLNLIKALKPIMSKIQKTNFRLSDNLIFTVLKEVDEI